MSETPTVTVLIPARNEEADIGRCLRAVLAQDHPHDRIEVILVDGGSTDGTVHAAKGLLGASEVDWTIVDNAVGTTPSNLNAGLAVASGRIVCRVDARSVVPPHYVRLCAELLQARPDVSVTGGAQVAIASDESLRASGIARALNNRLAMGGSRYRSHAESGPSDTVYLGAFRTDELRDLGGWDEYFQTNQDYELNRRLSGSGIVWYDARLAVGYVPRRTLTDLWRQYHRFGRWKVLYWRRTGDSPARRQKLLLVLYPTVVAGAIVGLGRGQRKGRSVVALAALAAVFEERGSSHDATTATERLVSMCAIGVVSTAWWTGVVRGSLRGARKWWG